MIKYVINLVYEGRSTTHAVITSMANNLKINRYIHIYKYKSFCTHPALYNIVTHQNTKP